MNRDPILWDDCEVPEEIAASVSPAGIPLSAALTGLALCMAISLFPGPLSCAMFAGSLLLLLGLFPLRNENRGFLSCFRLSGILNFVSFAVSLNQLALRFGAVSLENAQQVLLTLAMVLLLFLLILFRHAVALLKLSAGSKPRLLFLTVSAFLYAAAFMNRASVSFSGPVLNSLIVTFILLSYLPLLRLKKDLGGSLYCFRPSGPITDAMTCAAVSAAGGVLLTVLLVLL